MPDALISWSLLLRFSDQYVSHRGHYRNLGIAAAFSQTLLKKYGMFHEFAWHPCTRDHTNLLCIIPILVYVLPK